MRKHRDFKFITTERRRNFSQKIYQQQRWKNAEILINKPIHLGLSILELSKILMYEFWYDYVKLKYGEKAKLYYIEIVFHCVHKKR